MKIDWKISKKRYGGSQGYLVLSFFQEYKPRKGEAQTETIKLRDGRTRERKVSMNLKELDTQVKRLPVELKVSSAEVEDLTFIFDGERFINAHEDDIDILIFVPKNIHAKVWILVGFKDYEGKTIVGLKASISNSKHDAIINSFSQKFSEEKAKNMGFKIPKFLQGKGTVLRADIEKLTELHVQYESQDEEVQEPELQED